MRFDNPTSSESIYCFNYQVDHNGVQIKFDLDYTTVQSVIDVNIYRTALNERFVLVVESDVVAFYSLEMAFSLHLTIKIRYVDQTTILQAIQAAWATKRTGE